jgi:hypothetical protein
MKAACALAALLCASCMSTEAFLHPDQSISICHRDFLFSDDYWISPTAPGVITPASEIKLHYFDNAKFRMRERVSCEGWIDRTKDGVARVNLAVRRDRRDKWVVFGFNGNYRLNTSPAIPKH